MPRSLDPRTAGATAAEELLHQGDIENGADLFAATVGFITLISAYAPTHDFEALGSGPHDDFGASARLMRNLAGTLTAAANELQTLSQHNPALRSAAQ